VTYPNRHHASTHKEKSDRSEPPITARLLRSRNHFRGVVPNKKSAEAAASAGCKLDPDLEVVPLYSWLIGNPFQFYISELKGLLAATAADFYARRIPDNWLWFQADTNVAFFFVAIGISIVVLARAALTRSVDRRIVLPAIGVLKVPRLRRRPVFGFILRE
jgi:hypothetical protein